MPSSPRRELVFSGRGQSRTSEGIDSVTRISLVRARTLGLLEFQKFRRKIALLTRERDVQIPGCGSER